MKCPKCRTQEMTAETFEGIEIDRCSACRGMFFDKGELEQMIVRKISADTFAYSPGGWT